MNVPHGVDGGAGLKTLLFLLILEFPDVSYTVFQQEYHVLFLPVLRTVLDQVIPVK